MILLELRAIMDLGLEEALEDLRNTYLLNNVHDSVMITQLNQAFHIGSLLM